MRETLRLKICLNMSSQVLAMYSLKLIKDYERIEHRKNLDGTYAILLGIFVGCLVTANFTAVKLCDIFGLIVPAAVIAYSLTFTVTDIISDVYGRKASSYAVWAGFTANIAMVILVLGGWMLPPLAAQFQQRYEVLLSAPRIVMASMIAYLVSQNHDVIAFHFWKALTRGKHLWLRNNASTAISQLIDTCIFITLAFYGEVPTNILLRMIVSQYIMKLIIAACDTPFVYIGVKIVREGIEWRKVLPKSLTASSS